MFEFDDNWLTDPVFAGWLEKVEGMNQLAFCKVCIKDMRASRDVLVEHLSNETHKLRIAASLRSSVDQTQLSFADIGNASRRSAFGVAVVAIEGAAVAITAAEEANAAARVAIKAANDALSTLESTISATRCIDGPI